MARTRSRKGKELRRGVAVWGIILASIAIMGFILYFVYSNTIYGSGGAPYSLTARVNILITNSTGTPRQAAIPPSIGVDSRYWNYHALDQYGLNGRAPIYTRDNYGIVIVESSVVRSYTLGDFFKVWGKTFNSTCIEVDRLYCDDPDNSLLLSMVVNGNPVRGIAFDSYVLADGDVFRIEYAPVAL